MLAHILQQRTSFQVSAPDDGDPLHRGHIYVARPDHHLLLEPGRVLVTRGPREYRSRPAVDALFRSAAHAYGSRVIGVVLTGELDDGTAGLWWVRERGGATVVQDPEEAAHPSMPRSAIQHVEVDHIVGMEAMAPVLLLSHEVVKQPARAASKELRVQTAIAKEGRWSWGPSRRSPARSATACSCG